MGILRAGDCGLFSAKAQPNLAGEKASSLRNGCSYKLGKGCVAATRINYRCGMPATEGVSDWM